MLKKYLNNLQDTINQGDAREESYYKHLESLILDFSIGNKFKDINVTILPKKTEAGNPDFRVWDGSNHITGYIEAKDPSATNLDYIENSEQLKRYRNTFPNVILTNFYEFRLYRDSELIKTVSIGRPVIARKLKITPPVENENDFVELLNTFFSFSLPDIRTAKALALELAKRTRFLRDEVISIEIAEEEKQGKKAILSFYEAFKKYLIGTLTKEAFADLYSQTITYGLFAARTRSDNSFNRELAFKCIPNTIGILRDVFRFISLEDPPKPLQIIVDDIAEVLHVTEVKKILQDYFREGKGKDPIIHFYETFLTAYDPEIREKRGVYYTPEPVVKYIVRSINKILKTHFGLSDGLASPEVTLLDPAGGTLTFPAEAIKLAVKEYIKKYGRGGTSNLIKNQILPNYFAFEIMMAPYAIGHLKMSFLFEELGYRLADNERFKMFLSNTLEMEDLEQIQIPGLSSLSEESHLAGKVKKDEKILIILGNPPYSGISSNPGEKEISISTGATYVKDYFWNTDTNKVDKIYSNRVKKTRTVKQKTFIGDILMDYYFVDGASLGEKNPKWLQDDYVKFLRFAQWKIEKAGFGIVGMITNHSYLDNPTFRGMRQSLMKTFNEIYILDLHGNSLKKETCPDGSKDENVFDIRQGTSIALFVKQKQKKSCKVYHSELFGLRKEKYKWLDTNEFKTRKYTSISPESPYYFLVKRDTDKIKNYLAWKPINEIFPVNSVGIVTSRDNFVIAHSEDDLNNRIIQFKSKSPSNEFIAEDYGLKNKSNWKIENARKQIQQMKNYKEFIKTIQYRPFDNRFIFYHSSLIERMRENVMRHMLEKNISICFMRQFSGDTGYNHFFVSEYIVDNRTFFSAKGIIQQAPLYLYKEKNTKQTPIQTMLLFEPKAEYENKNRRANIDSKLYQLLENTYKKTLIPEEILYYIYGIFYSNMYRKKYAEFLKTDFPRVPFTKNYKLFKQICEFGEQLTEIHLLKSNLLNNPVSKYEGIGDNDRIEKVEYNQNEQKIHINKEKCFDGITPELWSYHIGGYQVLQKYLKDRKNRIMNDPRNYSRIVTAIHKTIETQNKIDNLYDNIESNLL